MEDYDLFGNPIVAAKEDVQHPRTSESSQGRYAEFMVCAYLTKMGHYALHVDVRGFDILLDYEGDTYRIDVKASEQIRSGPVKQSCSWTIHKNSQYQRTNGRTMQRLITPQDTDLLALFHHRFSTVVFHPVLVPTGRVSLPIQQVRDAGIGEESLAKAIKQLRNNKAKTDHLEKTLDIDDEAMDDLSAKNIR